VTKKSAAPAGTIHPDFFYRKHSAEARAVIGYGPSQLEEKIRSGDVDPPVALSESGRACGWYGSQLLAMKQRRIAQAERKALSKRK
jgi:hypothetical protein